MEKVITAGIERSGVDGAGVRESMDELRQLVETAGGVVLESLLQKRDRPTPATLIGRGKVQELAERIRVLGARTVVFDQELKPVQQRNLEEALSAKVVDRTRLILDIFARRARTREGILQVELAQLAYRLPRITEVFGRFEQQTGGIGTRGPGERKLEVDRRAIRDRMATLQKRIEKIRQERIIQRAVRRSVPMPQVSLVGYTNAGKSTLLNALLRRSAGDSKAPFRPVYADNKLFATLDPTTRRVRLPTGRVILFSDTVGFIRNLPTELIAAFRATLEEVATADLMLLVVDAADPDWKRQEATVEELLDQLGMDQLPRIRAYNKMDLLSVRKRASYQARGGLLISSETGEGLDPLLAAVEKTLAAQWVEKDLLLPYNQGRRLAMLHEHMDVLSQEMTDDGIRVRVRTHPSTLAQFESSHDSRE